MMTLNVLLMPGEDCVWWTQVLEKDIGVSGSSLAEVIERLEWQIRAEIIVARECGDPRLDNIDPAPQSFWDMKKKVSDL